MHEIMGVIWPMMAASAEAMMWFWIIVVLVIIGRGKILPSENPLVIERSGQYKMHLAPGLNLAQPFIEAIASQIHSGADTNRNGLAFCFKVRDKNIASRKQPFYLMDVSLQNGYLCFEARPAPQEPIPPDTASSVPDSSLFAMDDVEAAIHAVAKLWGINLHRIK